MKLTRSKKNAMFGIIVFIFTIWGCTVSHPKVSPNHIADLSPKKEISNADATKSAKANLKPEPENTTESLPSPAESKNSQPNTQKIIQKQPEQPVVENRIVLESSNTENTDTKEYLDFNEEFNSVSKNEKLDFNDSPKM